jgi:hypothetical protein
VATIARSPTAVCAFSLDELPGVSQRANAIAAASRCIFDVISIATKNTKSHNDARAGSTVIKYFLIWSFGAPKLISRPVSIRDDFK